MDASTLVARLEAATASFRNLERQLADPDVAADPTRLEKIARERARLEPLVLDFEKLQALESEQQQSRELLKESRGDAAMEELAQEDLASLNTRHAELTEAALPPLLPALVIPLLSPLMATSSRGETMAGVSLGVMILGAEAKNRGC